MSSGAKFRAERCDVKQKYRSHAIKLFNLRIRSPLAVPFLIS